jgi:hypothetical protein
VWCGHLYRYTAGPCVCTCFMHIRKAEKKHFGEIFIIKKNTSVVNVVRSTRPKTWLWLWSEPNVVLSVWWQVWWEDGSTNGPGYWYPGSTKFCLPLLWWLLSDMACLEGVVYLIFHDFCNCICFLFFAASSEADISLPVTYFNWMYTVTIRLLVVYLCFLLEWQSCFGVLNL